MSTIINTPAVNTRVYNAGLLQWENSKQPVISTDTLNASLPGVSTAARQDTGNTSLASILTELQSILTKLNASIAVTGAYQATQPVSVSTMSPTHASGQVNGSGNNTLITPAAGKKIRLFYSSYNPLLAVEAAFRFGAAGDLFLRNNVLANSVVAKEFGFSRYKEGAIDEALILNLSLGVNVIWNAFYSEV